MNEHACRFGDESHLTGILTEPDGPPRALLLLVSAGLVPKFGPFRLYTELARRLAREQIATLRFDLGGIGDSRRASPTLGLRDRTSREVRAAADYLAARWGATPLVLGGLCSGAEDSFRAAEHDPRVAGVVMIDPFAYRTRGFLPRHLVYRALRRTRRLLGLYRPIPKVAAAASGSDRLVSYEYMSRAESTRILAALVARGTSVHFVYTGGARESFNHRRQLKAMFPEVDFGDRVTLDHFPALEHTQMLEGDRARLVDAIAKRLRPLSRASEERARPVHELRVASSS